MKECETSWLSFHSEMNGMNLFDGRNRVNLGNFKNVIYISLK